MSAYKEKGKWTYEFLLNGRRYRKKGFNLKLEAQRAEAEKRQQLERPPTKIPTDMVFLDLSNNYLDYSKLHHSERWYQDKL